MGKFLLAWVLMLGLTASTLQAQSSNFDVRFLTYNIHREIGGSDSNSSSQPALPKIVNINHHADGIVVRVKHKSRMKPGY